ncbi:hypothetical protein G9A89_014293 [Geosiphon pyriformis]|nr:hypothetical protein G9A89_014293 [Geosiphon pyriformis]
MSIPVDNNYDSVLDELLSLSLALFACSDALVENHKIFRMEQKDILEEVEGKSAKSITVGDDIAEEFKGGVALVGRDPLFALH